MKSFSEYIKESYSFRLGGSQKKGFDQTANDLEMKLMNFFSDSNKIDELLAANEMADKEGWEDNTNTFNTALNNITIGKFYESSGYEIKYIDEKYKDAVMLSEPDYHYYQCHLMNNEWIAKVTNEKDDIIFLGLTKKKK